MPPPLWPDIVTCVYACRTSRRRASSTCSTRRCSPWRRSAARWRATCPARCSTLVRFAPRRWASSCAHVCRVSRSAAFVFFFPGLLAGPAFEYRQYDEWIKRVRVAGAALLLAHVPRVELHAQWCVGRSASRAHRPRVCWHRTPFAATMCVALTSHAHGRLSWPTCTSRCRSCRPRSCCSGTGRAGTRAPHAALALADWQARAASSMMYVVLSEMLMRYRYYLGWKLAEAAFCLSGAGYSGTKAHPVSKHDVHHWYGNGKALACVAHNLLVAGTTASTPASSASRGTRTRTPSPTTGTSPRTTGSSAVRSRACASCVPLTRRADVYFRVREGRRPSAINILVRSKDAHRSCEVQRHLTRSRRRSASI